MIANVLKKKSTGISGGQTRVHARMSDAYTNKRRQSKEDDTKWKRMDDKEGRCFCETAKADVD